MRETGGLSRAAAVQMLAMIAQATTQALALDLDPATRGTATFTLRAALLGLGDAAALLREEFYGD